CGRECQTNVNQAVSLSKRKEAIIGRAPGQPHQPLRKLNLVCDYTSSINEGDALANTNLSAAQCPTMTRSGHVAPISSFTSWHCVLPLHHRPRARNHCRRT